MIVIGYSFGQNGTKFKVPDLRGLFIRGWDNGKNTDKSRIFGTIQQDDNKSHNHTATVESIGNGGLPYAFVGSHGNAKTRYGTIGEGPGAGINTKNYKARFGIMEEQNQDQKIWHYYLVLDISKKYLI